MTALLASLAALWAFAAWVTVQDGLSLLWANTLDQKVSRPGVELVTALQEERRLTMVYLGGAGRQPRQPLDAQRARTDQAVAKFSESVKGDDVARAASDTLEARIDELLKGLNTLKVVRGQVNTLRPSRTAAAASYNSIIDSAFSVFGATGASLDDEQIVKDSRTLNALVRAKEMLSREDAHLAGVLTAGRPTEADLVEFTQLVGAQRTLHDEAAAELPPADRARYEEFTKSSEFRRLQTLENLMISKGRARTRPPVEAGEWHAATQPALEGVERIVRAGGDDLLERSKPVAAGIIVRLILAGGLGMVAVIASIVLSITTARTLLRQLELLRTAAWELANKRLPSVVERLGHGETVDVSAEAPPLQFGDDVIGQVGKAFNAVQETAIRTAVEQAELRRNFRDMLLSLARRSQTLLHRQLSLLDEMERRDMPDRDMEDLFRLDHLATRMRRNAENLIVLSGSVPARGWRRAVPMVDVVRAAVAEIEDYTRVTVLPFGQVGLVGRAVGDITHLLAELIENAVSFSPPYTTVQVGGQPVASGFAIEIEDRGLGMTDEKLAEINDRIANPPEFNPSGSVQLGLYVVGRLAERYHVRVQLKRSAYGGTTAVVVIPHDLVVENVEDELTRRVGGAPAMAAAPAGAQQGEIARGERPDAPAEGAAAASADGRQEPLPAPVPLPIDRAAGPDLLPAPGSTPSPDASADRPQAASGGSPTATTETSGSPMPENPPPVPETAHTPGGLPMRVPQANLVPQLRTEAPITAAESDEEDEELLRSPEEIRRIVGAYQSGTRRGRSDAAKKAASQAVSDEDDEPES
ncbi:nitrate- and nitrite sensing domain-containing protein [Thermomonospora catenispora]|uniref:sensor histidine kinase n=1 Tax=Thermomonospora catenispora TaxID=2493090 RepID=UPI001F4F37FB|nr:nitrate- and nitrite sensing domain-containing protein [Thermomonospora catenispora]